MRAAMIARHLFAILFVSLFSTDAMAACGLPVASDADQQTFTAVAGLRNTAEACIDLTQFTGQTVAIEVTAPGTVSGRIPGLYLMPVVENILTVQPGGGILVVTGNRSDLGSYRIALRIMNEEKPVEAVQAAWIFRGGQGFSRPQAVLTDGIREVLRLSCSGGELDPQTVGVPNPLSIDETFGQQIALGNGARINFMSVHHQGLEGRWYGVHRLGNVGIITPEERAFFDSAHLKFGERLIENNGAEWVYKRLKSACASGLAFGNHPAISCLPIGRGYPQSACIDPTIGTLDRQIAEMYGILTRLVPLADVRRHWEVYAEMDAALETCGQDAACFAQPLRTAYETFSGRLSGDILAALEEPNSSDDFVMSPADEALTSELIRHGMPPGRAQNAKVVLRDPSYTLLLIVEPSSADLVVLHLPASGADPLELRIDPTDVGLERAIAKHAAPAYVMNRPITHQRGRTLGGGILQAYHIISNSRSDAPAEKGAGLRYLAQTTYQVGGWVLDSGGIGSNMRIEGSWANAATAFELIAQERSAAEDAERQRREREERIARAREEAMAFETSSALEASRGGFIYKAAPFWDRFQNAAIMRGVFDGTSSASDSLVLGWAVAFDDHCASHLPPDVVVLEDEAIRVFRNGFGTEVGRSVERTRMSVDRRFEAAVQRARQSSVPTNLALDALNLGAGVPVNWDRVAAAADEIAQPYRDSLRIIGLGGCNGPITQQYLANLLASVGHGETVQESPILSPSESQAVSDTPAISDR